jgi:luciferase family oxidoreductase group 1
MIPFSLLDLSPIREGATFADALQDTRDLARHAEAHGYKRFWLAEHHGMPGIASTATSVLIGDVATHTDRIRVGAGGVMLPNHSPLVVAEQFGTLAAIHGDRIDLGLGRAPGTDQATARALRHDVRAAHRFEDEVLEVLSYFRPLEAQHTVRAIPAAGRSVPVWILGSSTDSARVAARLGLPYAFASHFAPGLLLDALALYRADFRPSAELDHPYVMVGANAVVADTDARAMHLFNSHRQMFRDVRRGQPGQLRAPVADLDAQLSSHEAIGIDQMLSVSIVGSPETARANVLQILDATAADELLFTSQIFDATASLRSVERLAEVRDALAADSANLVATRLP